MRRFTREYTLAAKEIKYKDNSHKELSGDISNKTTRQTQNMFKMHRFSAAVTNTSNSISQLLDIKV